MFLLTKTSKKLDKNRTWTKAHVQTTTHTVLNHIYVSQQIKFPNKNVQRSLNTAYVYVSFLLSCIHKAKFSSVCFTVYVVIWTFKGARRVRTQSLCIFADKIDCLHSKVYRITPQKYPRGWKFSYRNARVKNVQNRTKAVQKCILCTSTLRQKNVQIWNKNIWCVNPSQFVTWW